MLNLRISFVSLFLPVYQELTFLPFPITKNRNSGYTQKGCLVINVIVLYIIKYYAIFAFLYQVIKL